MWWNSMGEKKVFQLTKAQKGAVEARRNSIVTAGAGTGKTRVLAERFCHILQTEQIGVDQILTLTFTKKATTEMQERIYTTLAGIDNPHIQQELHRFHTAHISTLDSFCRSIVEKELLSLGYPPRTVQDAAMIAQGARDAIFSFFLKYRKDQVFQQLRDTIGTEVLREEVFLPIATNWIHPTRPIDFSHTYEVQSTYIKDQLTDAIAATLEVGENLPSITRIDLDDDSIANRVQELGELFSDKVLKGKRLKKEEKAVKKQVDTLVQMYQWYKRLPLLKQLFQYIDEFQQTWLEEKRQRGFLSFQDTLFMAIDLLRDNPELRIKHGSRFAYIMVDEVQDNNRHQWELLFLLAAKESFLKKEIPTIADIRSHVLFCVGDKKQSIYGFRGAEVSLFESIGEDVEAHGGMRHLLAENFRTEPRVIEWFNRVFDPLMPRYEHIEAGTEQGDGVVPEIGFIYGLKDQLGVDPRIGVGKQEAWEVAQHIQGMVDRGDHVRSGKGFHPISYEDVAVLFRTTTAQKEFEEVFKRLNIPYSVDTARTLYLEAVAQDLVYMTLLVLHPEEQAYMARALRSPYFGCNDETLITLLLQNKPLYQLDCSSLSADELSKFQRALGLMREIGELIDRESHSTVFKTLWYHGGYRCWLLQEEKTQSYLEHYYYIQALAKDADNRGITMHQFLHELIGNFGEAKRIEQAPLLPEQRGVSLITIHKSKGLEFPVVFIPKVDSSVRSKPMEPCFYSDTYGVSITPGSVKELGNIFAEASAESAEDFEKKELLRLLYVGVTRAKSHLFFSGILPKKINEKSLAHYILQDGNIESFDQPNGVQSLYQMEPLSYEKYCAHRGSSKQSATSMSTHYSSVHPAIPDGEDLTVVFVNQVMGKILTQGKPTPEKLPSLSVDTLRQYDNRFHGKFGSLCHAIAELNILGKPIPKYPCDENYWRGTYKEEWDTIFQDASRLVNLFLEQEQGLLVQPDTGEYYPMYPEESIIISFEQLVQSEESLGEKLSVELLREEVLKAYHRESATISRDPAHIVGQIDLIIDTPEKVKIIDFKTGQYKIEEEYYTQMALYAYAAKVIFQKPVETQLIYLREYLPKE